MSNIVEIDFSSCKPVNYLWPQLVERLGVEVAHNAAQQAFDLQRINGKRETLPVLFAETCGIALIQIDLLRHSTGIAFFEDRNMLSKSGHKVIIPNYLQFKKYFG